MAAANSSNPHFRILDVQRERIAGVAKDDLDLERVAVYALQRGEIER